MKAWKRQGFSLLKTAPHSNKSRHLKAVSMMQNYKLLFSLAKGVIKGSRHGWLQYKLKGGGRRKKKVRNGS